MPLVSIAATECHRPVCWIPGRARLIHKVPTASPPLGAQFRPVVHMMWRLSRSVRPYGGARELHTDL